MENENETKRRLQTLKELRAIDPTKASRISSRLARGTMKSYFVGEYLAYDIDECDNYKELKRGRPPKNLKK